MNRPIVPVIAAILAIACAVPASLAQVGAITIKGKGVKGLDKTRSPLARKRFYLFGGGLKENQPLIDRIKAAEITSRDCFYTEAKASACLIRWLQQENCESPFCRAVNQEDVARVPEFQAAYSKGLIAYKKRPDLALAWIINNMPSQLITGYYLQQKGTIAKTLAGLVPLQTIISTSAAVEVVFPGIPASGKPTKFTISNVLPIEIDNKSYVWTCEVDVTAGKTTALPLTMAANRKGCVLTVKDLKTCGTAKCEAPR